MNLLEAEIALGREGIELALDQLCSGKSAHDLAGFIGTETVDDDNAFGPAQPFQSSPNVGSFVECEDEWRDFLEHVSIGIEFNTADC